MLLLSIPFLRATLHRYLGLEAKSVYDSNSRVHYEWTRGSATSTMAASIKFLPGATIRWHGRQYVIVDYGFDAIIGREFGKRKLERIPIAEAQSDETARGRCVPPICDPC